jgi:hypothetical protein
MGGFSGFRKMGRSGFQNPESERTFRIRSVLDESVQGSRGRERRRRPGRGRSIFQTVRVDHPAGKVESGRKDLAAPMQSNCPALCACFFTRNSELETRSTKLETGSLMLPTRSNQEETRSPKFPPGPPPQKPPEGARAPEREG